MTAKKTIRLNSLSFGQKFKIVQWVGCIQERLKSEGPSYVSVCEWIKAEPSLGFNISPTTLRVICEDAQIKWEKKFKSPIGNGVSPIWTAIRELEESLKTVQDEVIKLMQSQESVRMQLAETQASIEKLCGSVTIKTTAVSAAKNDAPNTAVVNNRR